MTSNQRSLWNKVAPAIKRALLGARPDAAGLPAAARLPAARPLALEQRFMFDAAAVAATADAAHAARPEAAPPAEAQRPDAARQADATPAGADLARVAMAAEAPRREIVFVDNQVKDYQQLVAQVRPGTEVIVLDKTRDGLQQIADALRGRSGIDAIHIIGHGAEGSMRLGSVELNAAALNARQAQLTQIGAALTEQGDILLYGCDIGANAKGAELLSRLAQLTHADVAASSDRTGAAARGGNWTLEAASGKIETAALSFAYNDLLAAPPSQDFESWNRSPNGSAVLLLDGLKYRTDGGSVIDVTDAMDYFGETFTGFSGKVLLSNISGNPSTGSTFLEFGSQDRANNFALKSLTINAFDNASGFAQKYVISGYDDSSGTNALVQISIDLTTSGTYGTGDWAITYTKGSSTYSAGTLVFGSAWGNLDTVRLTANDRNRPASLALDSITLGAPVIVDAPPVVTPSAGSSTYSNGNGLPVQVDASLTLTDADSASLSHATVSLTGGSFHSGEDVLAFVNTNSALYGNIVSSWNASTGVLTLTSSGSLATVAQWEAALRAVIYHDSSTMPYQGDRTITFVVNDGTSDSSPVSKIMKILPNSPPVIGNLSGDAVTYTEKGAPVRLDAGAQVTVTDSDTPNFNSGNLTVQMVNNARANQDVLGIDTSGAISLSNGVTVGSVVSVSGVAIGVIAPSGDGANGNKLIVTFNANATQARVALLMSALTYKNTSSDPYTATRSIVFGIYDGRGGSASAVVSVDIAAVNDAPTLSATPLNPVHVPGGTGVALFSGASIDPGEAGQNIRLITFTVSGLADGASERLTIDGSTIALVNNTTVTTSGLGLSVTVTVIGNTATITVSSAGISAATANGVLNGITYQDARASASGGARVVTLTGVTDSGGTANGGVDTAVLSLASTITLPYAPVVTPSAGNPEFTIKGSTSVPVAVDGGITLSDSDSATLSRAVIAIVGNLQSSDMLLFTAMNGISGSYSAGVLTLSGSATVAQWEAALRSIRYTNNDAGASTATRTISIVVSDGSRDSDNVTRSITVKQFDPAPVVTPSAGATSFLSKGGGSHAVAVDAGLTLSDPDSTTLASARITIGNLQAGDVLGFVNDGATMGNVVGFYDPTTGILTLTSAGGLATVAQWQAALRAITFVNTRESTPVASRSISFQVSDGVNSSVVAAKSIDVQDGNIPPVLTLPSTLNFSEDTSGFITGISVSDADAGSGSVTLTLSVPAGRLYALTSGGVTVQGSGTGVLVLSGSVANLNAFIAALEVSFLAAPNANGDITLSVTINDNGNTGTDGAETASGTVTLRVAAVNDAPVITVPSGISLTEDIAGAITGISFSDVDAGAGQLTVTLSVTAGALSASSGSGIVIGGTATAMTLTGTLADLNAFIAASKVLYTPAANATGVVTLTVSINDNGNTGSGGSLSDTKTVDLNIAAVNDAPTIAVPVRLDFSEDTAGAVTGISIADVDAGGSVVTLTLAVPAGTLAALNANGVTVTGSGSGTLVLTGSIADINAFIAASRVSYLSAPNANGDVTLTATVNDLGNTGSGGALSASDTVVLRIAAVNDAPVITVPSSISLTEDTAGVITGITVSDVDAGSGLLTVTLSVPSGTLSAISGNGVTVGGSAGALTLTGSQADLNAFIAAGGLRYLPGANIAGQVTLSVSVNDNGNTGSGGGQTASASITLDIAAVNDAPVNIVPGSQQTAGGSPLVFDAAHGNAIRIQDVDAGGGQLLVTLSADHGLLRLSRVAGLTFMNGTANGSATLTFTGTLADINAALDGLVYEAAANYVGPATLRIVTDDQGNSGSGGALSATSSIAIAVTPSDVTPPSATLTLADALLAAGQSTRLTIRFSEAIQSLDASAFTLPGGTLAGLSSADGGLTWTATYTPAAGADLSNAVIALDLRQVRDLAGNAGSGSALSGALRIDTQPPASPALNLEQRALDPSGGLLSGNGVLRVDGLESGGRWQYSLDGGASWRDGQGSQLTLDAPGTHAVQVRQWDAAGNVSAVSSLSFSVQGQVPPYVHPTPPPGTLLPPLAPPVASLSPVADPRDEFLPSLGGAQAGSRSPAHASPLAWAMDEHGARQAPAPRATDERPAAAVYAPQRIGASDAPGQELVVLRGLTTLALEPGAALDLRIPSSVFGHTRADARIQLSLTLEDGRALPAWIRFDARSGRLQAEPPRGFAGEIALRLTARDERGNEASTVFKLSAGRHAAERQAPAGRSGLAEQMQRATQARTAAGAAQRLRG